MLTDYSVYRLHKVQSFGKSAPLHSRNNLNMYSSQSKNAIALSTFFGISMFSAIFMTSKSINFVVFGILPTQVQESFQWLNWALTASVAGLISLSLLLSTITYRSQQKPKLHKHHIEKQLKILGRLSIAEWGAIIGILLLLAGIVTTSVHKIKPVWIGLTLMFLFLAVKTMPKDDFRKKIDWPFLFLLGTLIGLAKAITFLGIDQMISFHLDGLADFMKENLYLFGNCSLLPNQEKIEAKGESAFLID